MKLVFILYCIFAVSLISSFHPYRSEVIFASRPYRNWFFVFEQRPITYEVDLGVLAIFTASIVGAGILLFYVSRNRGRS